MLTQTALRHGLPLYSDQHAIFVKNPSRPAILAEQLGGQRSTTQVQRALDEAGVGSIRPTSPQALRRGGLLFQYPLRIAPDAALSWEAGDSPCHLRWAADHGPGGVSRSRNASTAVCGSAMTTLTIGSSGWRRDILDGSAV